MFLCPYIHSLINYNNYYIGAVQISGPRNVTVCEGQTVEMQCVVNPFIIPVWKISGTIYSLFSIPSGTYSLDLQTFTLTIPNVSVSLNATTYQCFVHTPDSKIHLSTIGTLIVKEKRNVMVLSGGMLAVICIIVYSYIILYSYMLHNN